MNYLALNTGIDYLFLEGNTIIHQPTIKEIAFIGEQSFWLGCNILNFKKDKFLSQQDKNTSKQLDDFEILMSIINSPNIQIQKESDSVKMVLSLLFPTSELIFLEDRILLKGDSTESGYLDANNYDQFKQILIKMFCLNSNKNGQEEFNPKGDMARNIANKILEGRRIAAAAKGKQYKEEDLCILERYMSILAAINKKDKNDLSNYTVFQLFDEYERCSLLKEYEQNISIRLAGGGKDLKEPPNWMDNIHK